MPVRVRPRALQTPVDCESAGVFRFSRPATAGQSPVSRNGCYGKSGGFTIFAPPDIDFMNLAIVSAAIFLYFAAVISISLWAARKNRGSADFFRGGRRVAVACGRRGHGRHFHFRGDLRVGSGNGRGFSFLVSPDGRGLRGGLRRDRIFVAAALLPAESDKPLRIP